MLSLAENIVKEDDSVRQLRIGLSILLPKTCHITSAETAKVLGVGVATVVRLQKIIRDQVVGKPPKKGAWGGTTSHVMMG